VAWHVVQCVCVWQEHECQSDSKLTLPQVCNSKLKICVLLLLNFETTVNVVNKIFNSLKKTKAFEYEKNP